MIINIFMSIFYDKVFKINDKENYIHNLIFVILKNEYSIWRHSQVH